MKYLTTVGYHDGSFEIEVIISKNSETKSKAETLGKRSPFIAYFHEDKLVIGKGENPIIIDKKDKELYQCKVCRDESKIVVSDEDYERISWDEAMEYLKDTCKYFSLPFSLESYYYYVHEDGYELE